MTFKEIVELLTDFYYAILVIGIVIGLLKYKSLNKIHRSIIWYLLMMLCVAGLSWIAAFHYKNNHIVLLVYSFIELSLICLFYYKFLYKARHNTLRIISIAGLLYIGWEMIAYKLDAAQFQSYAKVVDNFIVILLALTYFHERINRYRDAKWENFQLNAIVLAFFSLNLLFFLPINFLINETSGLKFYFWFGNLVITILFNLYLTWYLWKNGRTRRS